jgi:hypothetical protein
MSLIFNARDVPNNGDFRPIFKFNNRKTKEPIDFTGAYIEIEIKDSDGCKKFEGSTDGGQISILDVGVFQLIVPASIMQGFCAGQYSWGGLYALNGGQDSLFTGSVNVKDGVAKK